VVLRRQLAAARSNPPTGNSDEGARRQGSTRLEVPGADFGSYRWGQTDPITPGLIDRPYVAGDSVRFTASANLLNALTRRKTETHTRFDLSVT
jgi:hypothetical protein